LQFGHLKRQICADGSPDPSGWGAGRLRRSDGIWCVVGRTGAAIWWPLESRPHKSRAMIRLPIKKYAALAVPGFIRCNRWTASYCRAYWLPALRAWCRCCMHHDTECACQICPSIHFDIRHSTFNIRHSLFISLFASRHSGLPVAHPAMHINWERYVFRFSQRETGNGEPESPFSEQATTEEVSMKLV